MLVSSLDHLQRPRADLLRTTTAGFKLYEQEDDATRDLAEFSFTNAIFAALVEGHASEINSKRNAMDVSIPVTQYVSSTSLTSQICSQNASKNAGDMISSLQMVYNRGRQAAITNDLVDIITGASAL